MIRFLQSQDDRIVKAIFIVIIGVVSVSMVVYLIPGLTGGSAVAPDTYAIVYPHWYSRILSTGDAISETRVQQMTENELRQQGPQYAGNPAIVKYFEQQVGQHLVQQQVLLQEAHKLGIYATNDDVRQYLRTGPTGQVIYPDGKYIGDNAYKQLIDERLHESVDEFESDDQGRHHGASPGGIHYRGCDGERPGGPRCLSQSRTSRSSSTMR